MPGNPFILNPFPLIVFPSVVAVQPKLPPVTNLSQQANFADLSALLSRA